MKLLILDNYDSFTYNIAHAVREAGVEPTVMRNDSIAPADIADYDKIILSPGPGLPSEAGIMPEVIRRYAAEKPMLGICLGHQAIAEAFGASLVNLDEVCHGIRTPIDIVADDYIFDGLDRRIDVGRYHSWAVDRDRFPDSLLITAIDDSGKIMALRHKSFDLHGVQFHPESIMTDCGIRIIANWLNH